MRYEAIVKRALSGKRGALVLLTITIALSIGLYFVVGALVHAGVLRSGTRVALRCLIIVLALCGGAFQQYSRFDKVPLRPLSKRRSTSTGPVLIGLVTGLQVLSLLSFPWPMVFIAAEGLSVLTLVGLALVKDKTAAD